MIVGAQENTSLFHTIAYLRADLKVGPYVKPRVCLEYVDRGESCIRPFSCNKGNHRGCPYNVKTLRFL